MLNQSFLTLILRKKKTIKIIPDSLEAFRDGFELFR